MSKFRRRVQYVAQLSWSYFNNETYYTWKEILILILVVSVVISVEDVCMLALITFCTTRSDISIPCQNQEGEFPHPKVPVWPPQDSDCLVLKYEAHLITAWICTIIKKSDHSASEAEDEVWVLSFIEYCKRKQNFSVSRFIFNDHHPFNIYMHACEEIRDIQCLMPSG